MLVAVFRARDDGERTGERIRALGHDVLLAPVLHVVPTGASLPVSSFDAVIFTSAHGVQSLRPGEADHLHGVPCFCVGSRTAECAAFAGFVDRRSGRANANQLAAMVRAALPAPARLLLVAGRDRKPAIEHGLADSGYRVSVAETYVAEATDRWSVAAEDSFRRTQVNVALHYSRRSAASALTCAEHGALVEQFKTVRHLCLSEDAAAPLRQIGCAEIGIADEPNEDSLLRLLSPAAAISRSMLHAIQV